MYRALVTLVICFVGIPNLAFGCSCLRANRPCQHLQGNDAIFVGKVIATVREKHDEGQNTFTYRYSMRFKVSESLSGNLGDEVTVETGSGGGDCGTPLPVGKSFVIFAYKNREDGKLWTGLCSDNLALEGESTDEKHVAEYRTLIATHSGSISGNVVSSKPVLPGDDVANVPPLPVAGMIVHANGVGFIAETKTASDGAYEFSRLPNGKYTIVPEKGNALDFSHQYEDSFRTEVGDGACATIDFNLQPVTRIRGHVSVPESNDKVRLQVVAIPTSLKKLDRYSGRRSSVDEKGGFDLWPLPPGDYYVGVNITSSADTESPFPPTYYPGVTEKAAAGIVHVVEGDVKDIELPLHDFAKPRTVHFVAIGSEGKPTKEIRILVEDLRNPGYVVNYEVFNLGPNDVGTMTIYSGYSYHLHALNFGGDLDSWCAKPVVIPDGTGPVEARIEIDQKADKCEISEIDGLKR